MKKQISKNFVKGNKVKDVREIQELARNHKSLYHEHWKIKPASIFLNQQLIIILRMIDLGSLYYIERIN